MIGSRNLRTPLLFAVRLVKLSPTLRRAAGVLLARFPRLRSGLDKSGFSGHGRATWRSRVDDLSPCSRQIYADIKSAVRDRSTDRGGASECGLPERPRLAFISPLPPEQSGIADYSAELLPELGRYYDIELITDQHVAPDLLLRVDYPVRSVAWFEMHSRSYARLLYHVGNSAFHAPMLGLVQRHPGVVVLHDFFLTELIEYMDATGAAPRVFVESLFASHGYAALKTLSDEGMETARERFACNLPVLARSIGTIVHSQLSIDLARDSYGEDASRYFAQVPFLRETKDTLDRDAARRRLGVDSDDFVVCSFGLVSPAKLHHRIVEAWLQSDRLNSAGCRLVFVGEDRLGSYARSLRKTIGDHGAGTRILITGYVSPEEYADWLAAADVAVQLRTQSRGETSASVFDCLAAGLPLIVNDHGSAKELPDAIVMRIGDSCSDEELTGALHRLKDDTHLRNELSRASEEYISQNHGRARVGAIYRDIIERFYSEHPLEQQRQLVESVACIHYPTGLSDTDIKAAAESIAANRQRTGLPQLFVDVSSLVHEDLRTGIQRVTRSILRELLLSPPSGFRVEPVYGAAGRYYYARRYTLDLLGLKGMQLLEAPIDAYQGDFFLGLDLAPTMVPDCRCELMKLHNRGVHLAWVVYDLLPISLPGHFPESVSDSFRHWLETVNELGDSLIAISRSTELELIRWLDASPKTGVARPRTAYFHLGADIQNSAPVLGLPANASRFLTILARCPTFLMVGTVEPRKGHDQVVAAFDHLWGRGKELNLVIVGKQGWMVDRLAERLRKHPERGHMLHWLEQVSDEYLEKIYLSSSALIAASVGEGFGLPLIEAAQHGLPILARDIPVFREVAQGGAYYFDTDHADALADRICDWLSLYARGSAPSSAAIKRLTWEQSKESLVAALLQT
jgi:glycosyltransferase involved in cell wall biosynthesis